MKDDEIIMQMPIVHGFKRIYRLRWVYHFADGTVKTGIWNGASNLFEDTAARINKTGLLTAQMQTEHIFRYGIKTVFECDGHDYISSKWIGTVSGGTGVGKWKKDAFVAAPHIMGLSFLTRTKRYTHFVDGTKSERLHRVNENIENIREHSIK